MLDNPKPPFHRANRLASQKVSEILAIGARAAELKKQGHPVIVLGLASRIFRHLRM